MYRTWIVAAQMQFSLERQDRPQRRIITGFDWFSFIFYCVDGANCRIANNHANKSTYLLQVEVREEREINQPQTDQINRQW